MPTDFPTPQQLHAFERFIGSFFSVLPKLGLAIVLFVVVALFLEMALVLTLRLLSMWYLARQQTVLLQLIPPAFRDKTPHATRELFVNLHGWDTIQPLVDKLLNRHIIYSAEVAASQTEGLRYFLRVPGTSKASFEKDIAAYSSEIKVRVAKEYISSVTTAQDARLLDFRLAGRSFAYPLQLHNSLAEHDPAGYLAAAMAHLGPNETVALQLVLEPTRIRQAKKLAQRLLYNNVLLGRLERHHSKSVGKSILSGIGTLSMFITDTISDVAHGPSNYTQHSRQASVVHREQAAAGLKPARTLSTIEQELAASVNDKLGEPLFRASMRALVVSPSAASRASIARDIRKSFGSFSTAYQSLQARYDFPYGIKGAYRFFMFRHRLPHALRRASCILSASEVAGIYHFPHSQSARTEDLVTSLGPTLAAPLIIKNNAREGKFDVVLGRNYHLGQQTDIGLTAADREKHVFIIGSTGSGKTTMLTYMMIQDLHHNRCFAFIDPHGDAAEMLLGHVPPERVDDVIYFNPDDLAHTVGLNVLELTPGLQGDELLREKDLVTESVISMFRKIFSKDDSGGHRVEYVLRNAIQTALYVPDATLFTVYDLLNDPDYCKQVVKTIDNEGLKKFWKNELGKAGEYQQVKMVAGITAKIGRFLFSASAKRILEQPRSTINFDDILDGKILICNFSKGLIGEDTSELLGVSVLAKIQLAALRRARVRQAERKPFYLYVDEFQNFATPSFVQMLSEARKYKLFLTMAEQSTAQQDDLRTINVILANVGTVICFRTGSPVDEQLLLPLFAPYITEGAISRLSSYNFYMRIAATTAQEPLSGETILYDAEGDEHIAKKVIAASRKNYTKTQVPNASAQEPDNQTSKDKKSDEPPSSSQQQDQDFPKGQ